MKKGVVIGILVVLVILAVGTYFFMKQTPKNLPEDIPNETNGDNLSNENISEGAQSYNIELKNFAFNPSTLTIKVGDIVTWTNMDSVSHTITSDSGTELSSQTFSNGESYSHTFNIAGTYTYHCTPHPNMKGTIIVEG